MNAETIITEVCKHYQVKMSELLASKDRRLIHGRQVLVYLLAKYGDMYLAEIGRLLDYRPDTIDKYIRLVKDRVNDNAAIGQAVRYIETTLETHELKRLQARITEILSA